MECRKSFVEKKGSRVRKSPLGRLHVLLVRTGGERIVGVLERESQGKRVSRKG
jgi:hypothetical protein